MLAGDQRIGEPDEPELLGSIARGLIGAAEGNLVEADVLRLPVRQGELKTVSATSFTDCGDAVRQ
jgi:hypothetical protein